MQNLIKLIRRFVIVLLLSSLFLLFLNTFAFGILLHSTISEESPWQTAQEAANQIQSTTDGYTMPDQVTRGLADRGIWAVLIDNQTLETLWQTDSLPYFVPESFTANIIANLKSGYIEDSPTFTGNSEYGLLIMGYPKESYWKLASPSWNYDLIEDFPRTLFIFLCLNISAIFFIYLTANKKLLQSLRPIAEGIQSLPTDEPAMLLERGPLSALAKDLNKTSAILVSQNEQLKKKETARANWIAGVSHDIRTPLSMVMGYAGQLKKDPQLSDHAHKKAGIILHQSEKIKKLIIDLNLASKLEYNMQPLHREEINAIALVRQVAADFVNTDMEGDYPLEFTVNNNCKLCLVLGDKELLKRAVMNLLQNSMNHNENGCNLFLSVRREDGQCRIVVEDNGIGVTDEAIEKLNRTPHYMMCDSNISEQGHGLGLLIVRQVAASHHGDFLIGHSPHGGFSANLILPCFDRSQGQ